MTVILNLIIKRFLKNSYFEAHDSKTSKFVKNTPLRVVFSTLSSLFEIIYQTRDTVFHHISNTEKRVENTTRSGVFLTNFEVFDIVMKHCDECLI